MQVEPEAEASRYRREAEHLRHAVELISDERLREQLLGQKERKQSPDLVGKVDGTA